jgi:glycosyltransferase involved in cell wall biosynthesis
MTLRLAILVSHPIQHFAPWHRELAKLPGIDLRVFFCCDWGARSYLDPEFQVPVEWDIPLLDGYDHKFLSILRRPSRLGFWQVDNPQVGQALDQFNPSIVKVFGYAHRTNWRVARWATDRRRPLLLYSDSNVKTQPSWAKRLAKRLIVRRFYDQVAGALFVGDNNRAYHKSYGIPETRLFPGCLPIDRTQLHKLIPDRIAVRRIVRERLRIPPEAFVVMMSGKYVQRKRPLDLVAAIKRTEAKYPVWSLLVGEGPERQAIEEFCRKKGVNHTVLTGFVNQSKIPEYYAAADAIAVPSSYDPHPLVVSEGASFGLPIIVSDQVGCIGASDTAQPGVNAIVYPCGQPDRLREAIERLYLDGKLYSSMSAGSLRIAAEQDVKIAAKSLAFAASELQQMGPR